MAASQQIKTLILIAALVMLTGLAILLVLLLGEGEEITAGQIILIALILLLWPAGILFNLFRKKRKVRAAARAESDAAATPAQNYDHLSRGAEEAVQWLRSSGTARNGDSAYVLPWFLLIGPPGSGKTSLLLSAGMTFNALPSQRRRDQNLLRPTAACDWRITDNAVLIDTAGRYHTESPSHKEDHDEWLGLMGALRNYRRQRLLDGIVIAVSAAGLLAAGEAEIEQQAAILRARLDEVIKHNGSQLPVYLVFTHADGLPGFTDFFRSLNATERNQVWGATIPLAKARTAHEQFDQEFDYLLESLMQRRLLRLSAAAAPAEQLNVFDFPLRIRDARNRFGRFTNALFRPNPFSELPLLRGFYFTSGAAVSGSSQTEGQEAESEGVRVTGQGMFVSDLFQQVLPGDRNIAAHFAQSQAGPGRMRKVMIAAAAIGALCLLLLIGMLVSFVNNRSLVSEAESAGQAVLRHIEATRNADAAAPVTEDELRDLNSLRQTITQLDENDQSWLAPVLTRFGLYSGGRISPRLHEIYFDFVSQRFLHPAVTKLEQYLTTTTPAEAKSDAATTDEGELDQYYNKLKAYLMLESQERVQQDELQKQLADYWPEPGQKENLAFYAAEVSLHADTNLRVPRFQAQGSLVRSARDKLVSYPASSRIYNQLLSRISQRLRKNNEAELIDLRKITEGQGTELFEVSHPQPVPGAFTKEAYYRYVLGDSLPSLVEEARKEDYVTNQTGAQNIDLKVIRDRYFRDYATHWKVFLESITLSKKQIETREKAEEALERLSAPNSPIVFLMDRVSYQTNLAEPPVTGGLIGWLKGFFASRTPLADNQAVKTTFGPVHTFINAKGETGAVAQYLRALEGLRAKLREVDGNWDKVAEKQRTKDLGLKASEDAVRAALGTMKDTPAGVLMLQPVTAVREAIFRGNYEELARRWEQLYPLARNLENAFPFAETATDVPVQDLSDFFNPGNGKFQEFLNLAKDYFNPQGEQWQLKPTAQGKFSDRFVKYLNDARRLQSALFPNGQLKVDCNLTLESGPDVELSVDGKTINTTDKKSDVFSWPNTSGAKITAKTGGTSLDFPRSWGLYRLFTKGGGNSRSVGRGYQLVWMLDNGTAVKAQLEPQSSKNPFDLNLFRLLRAPNSLTQ